ncbi:PstS family phosphate ABC transporter substrate-binding protein [Natroniella acetigena]|uniref:PstS family phosphate ABC transporter substrate-binding protein n=1 Tax=Natroniella acetigena TaxID=52004 RepID=UPI00200B8BCE|nr:PstS family phosphate ABC transporter substrate-binding protein [Natroniella acetigena]MCK8826526.1 PstS family phosphate ABC transporter substrate-binding protein [Natroniella acetigena]
MFNKKCLALSLALILTLGVLFSFTGQAGAFFGWFSSSDDAEQGYVQVRGSDTMVNIGQALAEAFMEQSEHEISVTGGGSGTGVAALINNEVDIANVSRDMTDSEVEQAAANGVDVYRGVIAMDGLAVVVNENNPVQDLTFDEIGAIYRGEITNWAELGGPDMEISLYGRQSNSGTFVYFRENVLDGDYCDTKNQMNGNAQIVEGVRADRSAIGYVGIGYATEGGQERSGLGVVNVAVDSNSEYASPLVPENVATGAYPLARPLNNYFNGQPTGAVLEFIEFIVSEEGQNVAVEAGFYPVSPEFQSVNDELLN